MSKTTRSLLAILFGVLGTVRAGGLSVDPSRTFQTMEGFGGALAYNQSWLVHDKWGGWNKDTTNLRALYDTLFRSSGLSILRLGNWVADEQTSVAHDSILVAQARLRNPDLKLLVSSWSPPASLKANGRVGGNTPHNTLKRDSLSGKFVYDRFGGWWKMSVQRLSRAGIVPTWISMQNEPDMNVGYQSCLFTPAENDTNNFTLTLPNLKFDSSAKGWSLSYLGAASAADAILATDSLVYRSAARAARVTVVKGHPTTPSNLRLNLPRWRAWPKVAYAITFWAKGSGTLEVGAVDTAGRPLVVTYAKTTLTATWQQVTARVVTSSQNDSGIKVFVSLGAATGVLHLDDFAVSARTPTAGIAPALLAVAESLATLPGGGPKILGPEVLGIEYKQHQKYSKNVDTSKIDGWAFHLYHGGTPGKPETFRSTFDTLKPTLAGKSSFMSEYFINSDTTQDWLNLGVLMQESFTRLDLSAWVAWDLAWPNNGAMVVIYWPWGPAPAHSPRGFSIRKSFYTLAQYARFVRPGWKRVPSVQAATDSALRTVAFVSADRDSATLVAINPGRSPVTITPSFGAGPAATATAWITDSTRNVAVLVPWKSGQNLTIPPRSIVTLAARFNKPPVAASFGDTARAGTTRRIVLRGTDPDGSVTAWSLDRLPLHGTARMVRDTVVYVPTAGYTGQDTLRYHVQDDLGAVSAVATVAIRVLPGQTTGVGPRRASPQVSGELGLRLGVPVVPVRTGRATAALETNPSSCLLEPCQEIELLLSSAGSVRVAIFDNLGVPLMRWERTLTRSEFAALPGTNDGRRIVVVRWNARAPSGEPVPVGVYLWAVEVVTSDGRSLREVRKLGVTPVRD